MTKQEILQNQSPAISHLAPRWAIIGIFMMMLVAGLAFAREFLMPVVLAVLLLLVFSPVRRQMERVGIPPGLSAFIIVGSLLAILTASMYWLSGPVSNWVERAPIIGQELEDAFRDLRGATQGVRDAADQVDKITEGEGDDPEVVRVRVEEQGNLVTLAMSIPVILAQVVFTLILLFFLLASGDMFYEKIVHAMPSFRDKRKAVRIAYDIERQLSRYLLAITVINACLGIAIGIAMWWFNMPTPVLFAILACLLNFIPYVGALIGVVLVTIVGLITFDSLQTALIVGSTYFALTFLEGQLITPYCVGRNLRLNTVVVFLSVSMFAWLWSVVGMLMATPLLVLVRTFCQHINSLNSVGMFLSERWSEIEAEPDEPEQEVTVEVKQNS